jgi:hypothetical protein
VTHHWMKGTLKAGRPLHPYHQTHADTNVPIVSVLKNNQIKPDHYLPNAP